MGYQEEGDGNSVQAELQSAPAQSTQSTFQSDAADDARLTTAAVFSWQELLDSSFDRGQETTTKKHNGRVGVGVTSHRADHTSSISPSSSAHPGVTDTGNGLEHL